LYVSKDIKKGDVISPENIKSVRPSYGLHPKYYEDVMGKVVRKNLQKGDRFKLEMLVEEDI